MTEGDSLQVHPFTRAVPRDIKHAVSAQHTPRQNHLLAALPVDDYQRLLPELEPVALPQGWTVHGAGDRERCLYFLTAGIVSWLHVTQNGASAQFAVTGREGVIGVASFLGGDSTPGQAVVLSAGYAYRLGAGPLQDELERNGALLRLLLRYTQALLVQIGQTAVCNRHHSLEQQLCRWILSCLDRLPSNELAMTQGLIANMLGVQREGVTKAIGKLERAGLIRCSRGHITVLDRSGMEAQACECYEVVKREYDRLLRSEHSTCNSGAQNVHWQ